MNGTTSSSSSGSLGSVATDWTIQGVGDFNGDGKTDILWRHTSGAAHIWLMNGTTSSSSSGSPGSVATDWTIQGVGDFNGDSKTDILWRHTSGVVHIWFMNGTTIGSSGSPGSVATDWTIQGVGDFNGDAKADILWRHISGVVYIWLMNGTSISSNGSPGSVGTDWQTAPSRCLSPFACDMLTEHNDVRTSGPFGPGNPAPSATVGGALLPFTWSEAPAIVAQGWAATCTWGHNPNRGPYGENIAAAGFHAGPQPPPPTAQDVVTGWASEAQDYGYAGNTCAAGEVCGHYTQIVWRSTTAIGCAMQYCTVNSPFGATFPNWYITVCDYSPPGNFPTQPY
jgi:Cysteine-rich secretory protein family/FG-GAP-like repeat